MIIDSEGSEIKLLIGHLKVQFVLFVEAVIGEFF